MNETIRNTLVAGIKILEPMVMAFVGFPANVILVSAMHGAEDRIAAGGMPSDAEIEGMRKAVEARMQSRLDEKFPNG